MSVLENERNKKLIIPTGKREQIMQKLKQLFPNGLFVHPDTYRMVDGEMLENKEYVYFFTDDLNNVSDKKFIGGAAGEGERGPAGV